MANGTIHDQIAADYAAKYGRTISVSSMQKMKNWQFLQEMGYGGVLKHLKADFHGVKDFKKQLATYSSTHWILRKAWAVIVSMVLSNAEIALKMFSGGILGQVGNIFRNVPGFGQVFATNFDELSSAGLGVIAAKAQSYATGSAGVPSQPSAVSGAPVSNRGLVAT